MKVRFCQILAFWIGCSMLLHGQGSVTIFGTVTDPSGGAVVGAKIAATNTSTGASRQAISGADGAYVISRLPIGVYSVIAESSGFKRFVQDNIRVAVDENRRVDVPFQVGRSEEHTSE